MKLQDSFVWRLSGYLNIFLINLSISLLVIRWFGVSNIQPLTVFVPPLITLILIVILDVLVIWRKP